MNSNKECRLIRGTVALPLIVNQSAIIYYSSSFTRTSPVISVTAVTKKYIRFETQDSIYCVLPTTAYETSAPIPYPVLTCA